MSAPPSAASPRPPQRLLPCSAAPSLPPLRRPSAKADPSAKAAQLPAPTSFAPPLSSSPPLRPFSPRFSFPSGSSLAAPLLSPALLSASSAGAALIGAKLVGAGRLRRPSRRSAAPSSPPCCSSLPPPSSHRCSALLLPPLPGRLLSARSSLVPGGSALCLPPAPLLPLSSFPSCSSLAAPLPSLLPSILPGPLLSARSSLVPGGSAALPAAAPSASLRLPSCPSPPFLLAPPWPPRSSLLPSSAWAAFIGAKLVGAGRLRRPSRRSAAPGQPLLPPRASTFVGVYLFFAAGCVIFVENIIPET